MLRNLIVLSVCCLPVSFCRAGDRPLKFVQAWGKLGKEPGEFHSPIGIAINAKDELYVAEFRNNRVQKFSADGKVLLQIPVEKMAGGVAVDKQNRIYVAPLMSHKICVYDETGKLLREWGKEGKSDGDFDQPGGIAIAADGTVYVADQVNRRVQRFTPEGEFLGKWGEYGSKPGQFDGVDGPKNRTGGPHFLAFDRKGNVFTTEGKLGRVQKFTPDGKPLLTFGSNSTEPGGFGGRPKNLPGPIGIAIDRWDRVWVSSTNNRVQCFSPEGKYLFGAESLTPGDQPGQFHTPHAMVFDSRDYLYVVDSQNQRVQKFSVPSGDQALASTGTLAKQAKLPPVPQIVAHRGLFKHAPENTLAAFGACLTLRCGFELDIRRTKDGQLVCIHDEDVRRTTNGKGKVSEFTLAELRNLDAGSWFETAFAGEKVPTLAEVFALLKATNAASVIIALDIKVEDETIAADIAKLADQHGLGRQLVCIGNTITSPNLRRQLRSASANLGVAVLAPKAEDLATALAEKSADWIYVRFQPTPEQSAQIHKAAKRVFLAGPLVAGNEPENWRQSRLAHVDAVLTDYPLNCREVWRETEVTHPVLAADHSTGKIAIISAKGDVEWEYPNKHDVHDLHVLPNGNILTHTSHTTVVEINRAKQIVWHYEARPKPGYTGKVEVHAFQRVAEGRTMIAESGNARIIEVDAKGMIVKEVPLKVQNPHPHRDTRMVRKLSGGNYLVCHEGDGCVREYDGDGKVVWEYKLDLGGRPRSPGHGPEGHGVEVFGAVRLINGNTLIAGGNNNRVLEVTPKGEIVWKIDQKELPGITLAWVTTLQVLPNGNIVIGNCHAGPENPQLIEVTRDKKVVWTFRDFRNFGNNLAVGQVLDIDGEVIR